MYPQVRPDSFSDVDMGVPAGTGLWFPTGNDFPLLLLLLLLTRWATSAGDY
jgi:hypothetical protein